MTCPSESGPHTKEAHKQFYVASIDELLVIDALAR